MKNKYYIRYNDLLNLFIAPKEHSDIKKEIARYKKLKLADPELGLVLYASKSEVLSFEYPKNINKILLLFKKLNINLNDIIAVIKTSSQDYKYTNYEWNVLNKTSSYLKSKGIEFGFEDIGTIYSAEQVENANSNIKSTAKKIQSQNLSPLEKIMSAYLQVTSREYTSEKIEEEPSISRSVYGLLNSNNIVCVGYAYWLKAIMDEIGDNNIKLYPNAVACSFDNEVIDSYHMNLIVYLKDDKYNIDGYYYLDPTWDSLSKKDESKNKLCYFLLPLKDINKISYHIRNKNAGLKEKEKTNYEKIRENNLPKWYNNKEESTCCNFTSDGLMPSKSFLNDYLAQNPKAAQTLSKHLLENEINKTSKIIENEKNKIDLICEVKALVERNSIPLVSKSDAKKLRIEISRQPNNNSAQKVRSFILKLSDEYYNSVFKSKHIVNFIDRVKEILIEYCEEEHVFEEYGDSLIRGEMNKFISKLKDFIEENEDVSFYLYKISKQQMSEIVYLAKIYFEESLSSGAYDEFYSIMLKNLAESYTTKVILDSTSIKKTLDNANYIVDKNVVRLNSLKRIKNPIYDKEKIIDSVCNKTHTDKFIDDIFYEKSSPIGIEKISSALGIVLKNQKSNSSNQQIEQIVKETINLSAKRSKKIFKQDATNALYSLSDKERI